MKRREALAAIAFLTAGGAMAQSRKVPRVAVLHAGSSKEPASAQREPFERGLRENGWPPGSTVVVEYHYADGNHAKLLEIAARLARSSIDVIVARGSVAIDAARKATSSIPIVMSATNDPVNEGFVSNLSKPGANITGIAVLVFELDGKRLEILREAFPSVRRVATLSNPNNDIGKYEERMNSLQVTARTLGIELVLFEARRDEDMPGILQDIGRARSDALLVRGDPQVIDVQRGPITAMAAAQRMPGIYPWRFFAEAGGLISYGSSLPGFHHRSATYVSRILKGAKAGDLAVEQPTTFELVINLRTARALGFELPKPLLFRADALIE